MKIFILLILLFSSQLKADELPTDIYESIEMIPFDRCGYFAAVYALDQIFKEKEIHSVIELGSWAGTSTRFFAYRVGETGKVYAIDHWMGTPNHNGESRDPRLPYIYQLFLSNIKHADLSNRIIPIRMTTDEAAVGLNIKADLIYIDASRSRQQVYRDVINWYNHLNAGGILCGAEWREPEIRAGVQQAAEDLGMTVQCDSKGYFWRLK